MLKKIVLALGVILAPLAPAMAGTGAPMPLTYVSVSTFAAGGALTPKTVWAFQNTSNTLDVQILKVEVSNASTGTYVGGLAQFWLYGSTSVTHSSVSQARTVSYSTANQTTPSYISISTNPTGVVYENASTGSLPLFRPLIVNNDETATANFTDAFNAGMDSTYGWASPLTLPHAQNRALVLEQRRLGTADISDGTIMVRVLYSVK